MVVSFLNYYQLVFPAYTYKSYQLCHFLPRKLAFLNQKKKKAKEKDQFGIIFLYQNLWKKITKILSIHERNEPFECRICKMKFAII